MANDKQHLPTQVGTDTWADDVNRFIAEMQALDAARAKAAEIAASLKSYSAQFEEILLKHNQQIEILRANGYYAEVKIVSQACEKALAAVTDKMLQESDLWEQMTGQISDLTLGQLTRIYKQSCQLLDYIDGKTSEVPVGFTTEQLNHIDKDSAVVQSLRNHVSSLHKEFAKKGSVEAFYADLKRGFDLIGKKAASA